MGQGSGLTVLRSRGAGIVIAVALLFGAVESAVAKDYRVWEKVEISLRAEGAYTNPYKEVEVWVDLEGPGFEKRCYGFWDGGDVFRVRVMATAPGTWRWRSGSNKEDSGLTGRKGRFEAVEWSEAEREENATRRGMMEGLHCQSSRRIRVSRISIGL